MTNQQKQDLKNLEAMNAEEYKLKYLAVTDRDMRRLHEILLTIGTKGIFATGQNRPDKDAWAVDTAKRIKVLFKHGDHANSKN